MDTVDKKIEEETGLSLGSNIGDRLSNLIMAVKRISELPFAKIVDMASVYETEPVGVLSEFKTLYFLNTVVIVQSITRVEETFRELQRIEKDMNGSSKKERNAPRIIDIDMIYFGSVCVETSELIVPHPRWCTRRFVVEPLCEVRPNIILPLQNKTVRDILSSLPEKPKVILYKCDWFKNI